MGLGAKEVTPFPTHEFTWLIWIYYHITLEVSSLLFLLILHCSLKSQLLPFTAFYFIGQLRGPKASSPPGITESSSCYLYLERNGLTGISSLPGQLLFPDTCTRYYGKAEATTGYVFLGKVLNHCMSSVAQQRTLSQEHPAKPHQTPDTQMVRYCLLF